MKIEIPNTYEEMQAWEPPVCETAEDLAALVAALVEREHDYGTCAYAMSFAALAAFRFVARKPETTGLQAGFADMDFLRRTRGMESFRITDANETLFPQYDPLGDLMAWMNSDDMQLWQRDKAKALLEKSQDAHPNVLRHWRKLAAYVPPPEEVKPNQ